jgi:lipid-A-disaccharide synthase
LFLEAAKWIQSRRPDLQLAIPCVNREREQQVRALVDALDVKLAVTIVRGRSREVMAAADVVLLASGTATLEAMLLKKPMVVGYRLSNLSFKIVSRMVKSPYIALPNLLAKKPLVPEFIQDDATPQALGEAVLERLENPEERKRLTQAFSEIHETLRQNADEQAASAIASLIGGKR